LEYLWFWFNEYMAHAELTKSSRKTYTSWFRRCHSFLTDNLNIVSPTVDEMNEDTLDDYLLYTKNRPCQQKSIFHPGSIMPEHVDPNTVRSAFYIIKALCIYLMKKEVITNNPYLLIDLPKRKYNTGLRPQAEDENIMKVIQAASEIPDPAARVLNKAIPWTLADACIRVTALTNMTMTGLDWQDSKQR